MPIATMYMLQRTSKAKLAPGHFFQRKINCLGWDLNSHSSLKVHPHQQTQYEGCEKVKSVLMCTVYVGASLQGLVYIVHVHNIDFSQP